MEPRLDLAALGEKARSLRLDILDMTTGVVSGHVSSSYSSVEILTAICSGGPSMSGIRCYRADEPNWSTRDRFIMSKGHATLVRRLHLLRGNRPCQ